jgi:SAM-dependent methyltransferase
MHRELVRSYFDSTAPSFQRWRNLNAYYYQDIEALYRAMVPSGSRVLEIGSGNGDLLAAVAPARGVGIDSSSALVEMARRRYPDLTFYEMDAEDLDLDETFDYVIVAGTLGHITDIQLALERIQRVCTPRTRIIINFHNYLWEPVLRLGERIRQRMPLPAQSWLSESDVVNLLEMTGYRVVKRGQRLLVPRDVPVVANVVNRYVAHLPLLEKACLTGYVVARQNDARDVSEYGNQYSCSVIIPARNERDNIENVMRRMPSLGKHTEVIFVEGHSHDGTFEEIQRVAKAYDAAWDIKVLKQQGKGKGDAVRQGFDAASGDVLIILDADLTVAPEDLPKFFDVIVSGRGEFANGSRMVYPRSSAAMPFRNALANKFFASTFSFLLGQRLKDTLCGTKALWRHDYQKIAAGRAFFGEFDPFGDFDLLFGAAQLNLHIVDIPVRYEGRHYGQSNIEHTREGLILLRMCAYASKKLKFV